MNLGERCDLCEAHGLQNVDEEEYKLHIEMKQKARYEKDENKKKAIAGLAHVFVMDVQAVKQQLTKRIHPTSKRN